MALMIAEVLFLRGEERAVKATSTTTTPKHANKNHFFKTKKTLLLFTKVIFRYINGV